MEKVFEYTMLDSGRSDEEKKLFDGPKNNVDMEGLHTVGAETAADGIFSTFFEEPANGEMITGISYLHQSKKITFEVHLEDRFYNKLIGKYMNQNELLKKLTVNLQKAFDAVCWKGVAKKGGCDGHCH